MSNDPIPQGSTVLITGINGYIASHVADQLLARGFAVRGTARDDRKLKSIIETLRKRHPSGNITGVVIPDMSSPHAFDAVLEGCAGVCHVASDVTLSSDPNKVIPTAVSGVRNALTAAAAVPSITRFVYTSSSSAVAKPLVNTRAHVDASWWNDAAVKEAWAPPPYEPSRAFAVYSASKVESERFAWKFVKDEAPGFVFNTVVPTMTMGPILDPLQHGSTAGWIKGLYDGDVARSAMLQNFFPQYMIDVRDVARLHVAALVEPDVQNERILGYGHPYNNNDLVAFFRKHDPNWTLRVPNIEGDDFRDLSTVENGKYVELLKRYGRLGFTPMEQVLKEQFGF